MRHPPPSTVIRALYALCMAGAAFNHARIVYAHGWAWDYGGVHPLLAAFWTALTVLDPLAVLLLAALPRAGLALTAVIIVADVAVNVCAGLAYRFDWASFGAQFLFMTIVLATLRPAWRNVKKNTRKAPINHYIS